eukprot:5617261-Pleurochrysis_carterae.AAC.1
MRGDLFDKAPLEARACVPLQGWMKVRGRHRRRSHQETVQLLEGGEDSVFSVREVVAPSQQRRSVRALVVSELGPEGAQTV